MRSRSANTWRMGKRKTAESEHHETAAAGKKRAKRGEDPCGKFLSLVATEDTVIVGLTYFLTTSQRDGESSSLLEVYLQRCPECEHILQPLGWGKERRTHDVLLLCFQCLEQVLLFIASTDDHSTINSSTGSKLVQSILRNHMRPVYSSLVTTVPMVLIAACLRLLAAMVAQGPRSAREVQQTFNFGYKPLEFLPHKSHLIQGTDDSVRSCFIKFALSFLVIGGDHVIRAILELKGFLSSIFKLLPKDPVETVYFVLSTLMQRVVQNPHISKKLKSLFFSQYVLKQTAQLLVDLKREEQNILVASGASESVSLRQFVFQFLLKLCTDFQCGVCYRSKEISLGSERTNNPVILQLLLSLSGSVTTHPLAQDLTVRTISTCPDLLLSYLRSTSFSFEPSPTSKWVKMMQFLIRLFSALPPVPELMAMDEIHLPPSSHLSTGVGFTVPVVTSRSMLSQGIQNATPLVRFETLSLMHLALKRATAVVEHCQPQERSTKAGSYCVQYCDAVLKSLPDIKTVISLRQQLLGGGTPTSMSTDSMSLTPDEVHRNAELAENNSLLALTVAVMQGYQKLFPAIFAQADFSVAKLIPPLSGVDQARSCDSEVLVPTLQLLLDAPPDGLMWQQQGAVTLSSILWLYLTGSEEVTEIALKLVLKWLLGTDAFRGHSLDLQVVLSVLKAHHCTVALNSAEETHCLVRFVCDVFLAAVKDPYTHLETVNQVLQKGGGAEGQEEGVKHYSLKDITDAPLKTLKAPPTEASHTCTKKAYRSNVAAVTSPLVPCLLSQFTEMKPGPLSLFVSATLVRLFLVPESCEVFARMVVYYLGLQAMREQYLPSCWSGLYTSLLQFFSTWLPDHVGKVEEYSMEASGKLSAKKIQKSIQKMSANAEEVFEILSSLQSDDLIRFLPSTMETKGLQQILAHYASIRPMGIVGSADDPHVASLLESLPFTSILIQSISSQTAPKEQLSHSAALSSLLETLNSLELRELLKQRLEMAVGDHLELVCSVNVILKLLEMIYVPGKNFYITGNQRITLEFCFELLTCIISKTCSNRVCLQTQTNSDDILMLPSLLSVIFGSCVIKDAFLSEFDVVKNQHSVCLTRGGKDKGNGTTNVSSLNVDCTFSQGVGDLVVLALEHCEQFKCVSEFSHLAEIVFTVCEDLVESSPTLDHGLSELVLYLLEKMKPYLDKNRLVGFSEKMILSVHLVSDSSVDVFTDILEVILLAGRSSESIESVERESQDVRVLNISDLAVTKLIALASEVGSEKLDLITYSVLVTKINQSNDFSRSFQDFHLPCTSTHQVNSQTDDCIMSLKSLVKNLITPSDSIEQLPHVVQARPNCLAIHSAFDGKLSSVCRESDTEKLLLALHRAVQDKNLFTASDCNKLLHLHGQADHLNCSSWLSRTVLVKLLHYCLGDLNIVRARMVAVLLRFDVAFEYFSVSAVQQLCERTESESDHTQLQVCLYLLEQYLYITERRQKGSRLCDFCKKAVKVVRRHLWSKCSHLIADRLTPLDLQATCSHILQLLCCLSSKARKQFKKLSKCWKDDEHWNIHQLLLGVWVACLATDSHLSQLVVSRAVGKLTEMLATGRIKDQDSVDEDKLVDLTCQLLREHTEGSLSVSSLGCFVQNALRQRFTSAQMLQLLAALVKCVYGNSTTTSQNGFSPETMYEMVWSHSEFLPVMCSSHDSQEDLVRVKEQLVGLLVTLVELEPSVCRSSHITVLLGAYSATSSLADRGVLYLLSLYEQNGASLGDYRPFLWGPAALEQYKLKQEVGWLLWKQPGTQEVIELLDRGMLDHSTKEFPLDLELEPVSPFLEPASEGENTRAVPLYDPCFLLPLFSHLLDSNCVVDCRQFIDCGCLGYITASLSSRVETVRAAGSHALSRFTMHLEGARFKEKLQILTLIEVLRNSLEVKNARLPSLFAVFAARVARLFLYPEKDLYPLIARFMAAKPSMDLSEIPLYYSMMHSSSAQCCQEQVWMLRLLVGGLRSEEDYHLYRKRRVFAHVMAIFNSPFVGKESKSIILEIILKACSIPLVATDLVWNQGLLTWLQQLGIADRDPLAVLCQTSLKEQSKDGEIQPRINLPPLFEEELTLTV